MWYVPCTERLLRENRNNGRGDFQLLYVVEGEPVYTINGQSLQATAGTLILYKPYESQKYIYSTEKAFGSTDPLLEQNLNKF
ncbi:MAG: AraC family ligand binding domain-containing protein [Oscillospiraceae bacterium]